MSEDNGVCVVTPSVMSVSASVSTSTCTIEFSQPIQITCKMI